MKPLIGITTGEIVNQSEPWVPQIYGQKYQYSEAVIAAGGVPILIPVMPEATLKDLYTRLDGIIFAGGNDIDPQLYGETPEDRLDDVSKERDQAEIMLMTWALADDKPFFAICRGFQLFNVLLGGSLHQNLTGPVDHELALHKKDYSQIAHELKVAPTSKLAYITDSLTLKANSRHHQGIKQSAPELIETAWSEDGLVEGLEYPIKKFALGVQCHPEWLHGTDPKWAAVFQAFVSATLPKPLPRKRFDLKKLIKVKK